MATLIVARVLAALAVTLPVCGFIFLGRLGDMALGKPELMARAEWHIDRNLASPTAPVSHALIFLVLIVGFLTIYEALARLFEYLGTLLARRMASAVGSGGPSDGAL